jgi:Schlafen, AlbA_2
MFKFRPSIIFLFHFLRTKKLHRLTRCSSFCFSEEAKEVSDGIAREVLGREIEDIDEDCLQSLIDNKKIERKTLDYKKTLYFGYDKVTKKIQWNDDAKAEFAKDISSFANARGGIIFCGIDDLGTGVPVAITSLDITENDRETIENAMASVLRAKVEPSVAQIHFHTVKVKSSRLVYVIEIPKSWRSPHRVSVKGRFEFWSREPSAGKYQLDVGELREAFILSETKIDRIRQFREDRISKVLANDMLVYFNERDTDKLILHLIPIDAFSPSKRYNLPEIDANQSLIPLFASGYDHQAPNLDGILTRCAVYSSKGESNSYVQLYRDGIIEAVCGNLLQSDLIKRDTLYIDFFQEELKKSVGNYVKVLDSLSVEPPIYLFLTLVGVEGAILTWKDASPFSRSRIDRDVLVMPEICVPRYDAVQEALKECFKLIGNAGGYSEPLV